MRVDETGHDVAAGRVDLLGSLVVAEPGDVPLGDRDVGLEPFAPGPPFKATIPARLRGEYPSPKCRC
ncbi:MAG: hypothetical protein AUG43_03250 [Actinobacteria bacterium 13_1_20CM_3_68_10]|nr:MAG: hypothetical protein AUG43_03250 [Actinobacteria bacterium 13_1_20CM_3_68_10]